MLQVIWWVQKSCQYDKITIVMESVYHWKTNCFYMYCWWRHQFHIVPIFEICADETLTFYIRAYLWKLPINHIIYTEYSQSLKKYYCFKPSKQSAVVWNFFGHNWQFIFEFIHIIHSTFNTETILYPIKWITITRNKILYIFFLSYYGKDMCLLYPIGGKG